MARRHRLNRIRKLSVMDDYTPLPHQKAFHQSDAKYRAMVSGVGAGKTLMGSKEVIKWTQLYPGSLYVIGRLTAKALRETTQKRFFEICPNYLIDDFNKTEAKLWLKTPKSGVYSEILFMHLDEPGPLGSLDISGFWIDEAHEPDGEEVPVTTFQMLMARLRHEVGPHRGFITSNSGGKDWIWNYFFDPKKIARDKELLRRYVDGEIAVKPATFWSVNVPTSANPFLPEGYVEQLKANNPEHWVKRFLDGSFDVFEGQIFPEFDDSEFSYELPVLERHTYRDHEVEISPFWRKERGFDFGVTAPTATIYGAVAEIDGVEHLFIYDEYYQANAEIELVAKDIKQKGFDYVYADPSTQYKGADKRTPADLYMSEGIVLLPSTNNEDTFFTLLHRYLRQNTIHINKDRCPNLINEIKSAAWDSSTVKGTVGREKPRKDLAHPDHARDALKYLMLGLGAFEGQNALNPVTPGNPVETRQGQDFNDHPSYYEDEDNDCWEDLMKGNEYYGII